MLERFLQYFALQSFHCLKFQEQKVRLLHQIIQEFLAPSHQTIQEHYRFKEEIKDLSF